ncbi:sialidase family protein [Adhaeretor mobilis]|uniref:exo-alpha-sialidase n=1 Tax=Adhaeretor mobilis TaxID=1930276 RepID=A0A517MW41_9BACT|nr:sialidase family protein [Adhaeretor mobilis]QDS99096.1 Sialidase precursor [Adhaeretor mobilis]
MTFRYGILIAATVLNFLASFTNNACADDGRRFDPDALESRFSSEVFGYTHREGFKSQYGYRIPSVIVTGDDVVLAIIERRHGLGDHSENDIVLRRSEDGGMTWGEVIVIDDRGDHCLVNPCAVLIPKTGRVLVMYQDYASDRHSVDIPHKHVKQVEPGYEGNNVVRTFVSHSDDKGETWSEPRDISRGTKRDGIGPVGCGPGIGIVLSKGKHAGRIIIPFNETLHVENDIRQYRVYASYSDDEGDTWQIGEPAPFDEENYQGSGGEVQMVELSGGRVMLNSRSYLGKNYRKTSISDDGGKTWSPVVDQEQLPEPVCMGSILRVKHPGDSEEFLLFSNPASKEARKQGTIYASYDDGKTWPESWLIQPHEFAYSCLTQFSDGSIGCLYEGKGYKRIIFTRFSLEDFFRNAVKNK